MELTAWLLSKLHVIRQLKCILKMIIQTERFRESSYIKYCKTAMLVEKNVATLLACHFGVWGPSITTCLATEKLNIFR